MKPREKKYWQKATGMLGGEGPAPVPADLAARAFSRALASESRPLPSWLDTLLSYACWAAPCLLAAALLLLLLPPPAPISKADASNPVKIAWEMDVQAISGRSLVTAILATPEESEEVRK